jgi:hypothetical protein
MLAFRVDRSLSTSKDKAEYLLSDLTGMLMRASFSDILFDEVEVEV